MVTATLNRFFYGESVTLGFMALGDSLVYTCEDGWHGNRPRISCIPDGEYIVTPRRYNKGGYDAWEIAGVPGRSLILFHKGNKADDVEGCIVPGTGLGVLAGMLAVTDSAGGFSTMRALLPTAADWMLKIRPVPPLVGTGR